MPEDHNQTGLVIILVFRVDRQRMTGAVTAMETGGNRLYASICKTDVKLQLARQIVSRFPRKKIFQKKFVKKKESSLQTAFISDIAA